MGIRQETKKMLPGLFAAGAVFAVGLLGTGSFFEGTKDPAAKSRHEEMLRAAGQWFVESLWNQVNPASLEYSGEGGQAFKAGDPDPSFRKMMEERQFYSEHQYLDWYGDENTGETEENVLGENALDGSGEKPRQEAFSQTSPAVGLEERPTTGMIYPLEQLMDYDFLVKHFYNIHTSTTAGRILLDAKTLLEKDLSLEKNSENPQILIYHTHSQEAYRDGEPGQTITQVGGRLAELLEEKGYKVYHDATVYDLQDGKMDRSKAYNYALEGVEKVLEENPSIEVVLDLHRDGVGEKVRLVTEVDGKDTAQIMFFNGLSQTPEGPIQYLPNPNREANLAFSLKLQLEAQAYYPGFARKIYLKGLRYNQHLRPRSSLIEVGAQTNTYKEALNAMEPLAELLDRVLQGK